MQDLPDGNDDAGVWQRDTTSDGYLRAQFEAKRLTTKEIPFVCGQCIETAIARKTQKNVHYFEVMRCKPCNALKARYQRTRTYAKRLYDYAVNFDMTVWAITITLGNDVEKRVEHTTVDKLRRQMMYKMNRLREKSPEWNQWIVGGYQVFEHTEKNGSYHPHLHIVALSPLKRLPLKNTPKGRVTLQSVLKKFKFGEYVYATQAYTYKEGVKVFATTKKAIQAAVQYAMKYAMKDTGGSRKLSTFGVLRGYEIQAEDEPLLYVLEEEVAPRRLPDEGIAPRTVAKVYWPTALDQF